MEVVRFAGRVEVGWSGRGGREGGVYTMEWSLRLRGLER